MEITFLRVDVFSFRGQFHIALVGNQELVASVEYLILGPGFVLI